MILIDNRNVLRLKDRILLQRLSKWDNESPSKTVQVEQAKTGVSTIKVTLEGKSQYLLSKYDPEREAVRFVDKFKEEEHRHVLFVGIGMGYHIEHFIKTHPDTKFAIYEPNEEILHAYLSNISLEKLPLKQLEMIFTGTNESEILPNMKNLLGLSNNVLKIITLPVYEKLYGAEIHMLLEKALDAVKDRHNTFSTNAAFQKRWTLNSIKNFPIVLKTPNILHDIDRGAFEGKPAIIVAAGPSLNEEFENLRYIKEHGLAYILSVGSAINALIEQGIYPDAACTFDPKENNHVVIQRIKDENITDIPLIFGSSVGFETLEDYPGQLLHMITSQDTIAPQFLNAKLEIDTVLDAPSIAIVTFQLLSKLKCNPIVFVGQNLSYLDKYRYADGIKYEHVENELTKEEQESLIPVIDVYGNEVFTKEGMLRMRQQLELYIKHSKNIEALNTTKGGAQIAGTTFIHLEEVINVYLKERVVSSTWIDDINSYDKDFTEEQITKLSLAMKSSYKLLQNALDELKKINNAVETRQTKKLVGYFASFDKEFSKFKRNRFYIGFIEPMVRVQYGLLSEETQSIKYESDVLRKAEIIVNTYNNFISEVYTHIQFVKPYFEEMKERIKKDNEKNTSPAQY